MKSQIFGRKVGSNTTFNLLINSDGVSKLNPKADTKLIREFELSNTRRAVANLRERAIEGYVVFEGDSTQYLFTPKMDFVYPKRPK